MEEAPEAIAVEAGERQFTYAELDAAAAGIAAGLRDAGVGEEEPVGICPPRSWEGVSALLGTVRAGGACLPLDPSSPPARRAALLELAGARVVLSDRRHGRDLPPDVTVLDPAALASQPGEAAVAAGGDWLAYLVFTSGSTGTPKGVEITHGNLVHLFDTGSDLVPMPGDVVIAAAAIEFDIAILEVWGALAAGARLVLAPAGRPDPRQLGRLIAEHGVSFAFFAAGLFEQVTRVALPDLAGLRLIAAGGDVMPPAAAAAIRAAHPASAWSTATARLSRRSSPPPTRSTGSTARRCRSAGRCPATASTSSARGRSRSSPASRASSGSPAPASPAATGGTRS